MPRDSPFSIFSLDRQAAIDLNHLAGDIASVVGKQEAGNAGDFIGLSKTAQRNLLDDFRAICLTGAIVASVFGRREVGNAAS